MCKARTLPAESLIQKIVKRQRREPLLATDDLGDLHQVVVDDVGEVVGGQFVCPLPEHFVVEGGSRNLHVAADKVVHRHHAAFRHLEPDSPVSSLREQPLNFISRKSKRIAQSTPGFVVVDKSLAGSLCGSAAGCKFLRRVECIICPALSHQFFSISPVDGAPL